jgi:hypothetical protein
MSCRQVSFLPVRTDQDTPAVYLKTITGCGIYGSEVVKQNPSDETPARYVTFTDDPAAEAEDIAADVAAGRYPFQFDPYSKDFNLSTDADAIRAAAACNARLNALRRAFQDHRDTDLIEHAYWSGSIAPTPSLSCDLYAARFARLSANRRRKYFAAIPDAETAGAVAGYSGAQS